MSRIFSFMLALLLMSKAVFGSDLNLDKAKVFSDSTTLKEVVTTKEFKDFGRFMFPLDLSLNEDMTITELSSPRVLMWYSHINKDKSVEILNYFKTKASNGQQIFYKLYSDEEIKQDPSKAKTGLFFFKGKKNAPFAITCAGGGFYYVAALHDGFPQALEISKKGYNAFSLIYRTDNPYEDLARAITFIVDHASTLEVDADNYSLWGGSAGARMAAVLGNQAFLRELTARTDIQRAKAVITQYTGYSYVSHDDAPTFVVVGTEDRISNYKIMQRRVASLKDLGIDSQAKVYEGLPHGFGLGEGTIAKGWLSDAISFWMKQSQK